MTPEQLDELEALHAAGDIDPFPVTAKALREAWAVIDHYERKDGPTFQAHLGEVRAEWSLAEAKAEIARLTHNLCQTEDTLRSYENTSADAWAEIEKLNDELAVKTKALEDARTSTFHAMGQRDEARRWMMRLTNSRETIDLSTEKDAVLQEVERLRVELAFAEETHEGRERELDEALSDLEDARAEIERLEKLCKERTRERDEARKQAVTLDGKQLEDANAKIVGLETICRERQTQILMLEQQRRDYKAELDEAHKVTLRAANDWDRRLKQLTQERDEARAEVERLKGKLMEEARWVYDTGQRAKDALAEVERLREVARQVHALVSTVRATAVLDDIEKLREIHEITKGMVE